MAESLPNLVKEIDIQIQEIEFQTGRSQRDHSEIYCK